jgi:hypothetical protein
MTRMTNSGISYQLRDIYTPHACAVGMLLHVTAKLTVEKNYTIVSFVVIIFVFNRPSLSVSIYRSMYEAYIAVSIVSFISISTE